MKQKRWFCSVCQREWLYAHAWDESHGCPVCHSPRIERLTYTPEVRGLDLPRDVLLGQAVINTAILDMQSPSEDLQARVERIDNPILTREKKSLEAMPELL